MKDERKTKKQLIAELTELRQQVAELEAAEAKRGRAKRARQTRTEQYRSLFDGIPVGLYRSAPDGRILHANPALVQMLGYPDLKALKTINAAQVYVNSEDRKQWQALMEREGSVSGHESRWRRYDGTIIWVRDTAHAVRDARGQAKYYEGAVEGITERKQAEEALRESEQKFRLLSEQSMIGVVIVQDDVFKYVNQAASDIFEYSCEEMLDWKAKEYARPIHPEHTSFVMEQARKKQVGEEDIVANYVWRATTRSGQTKWVETYSKSVLFGGRPADLVTMLDVTERKYLEEQARQQERLAAVGQLAGGIAHDFNNILTTIMLYAQMGLVRDELSADVARAFETILDESQQATELVRRILDFSRRSVMGALPVDLVFCADKAVDILRRTLPENIRLVLKVEAGEYIVNGDPTRIQQVLMNLALNARDAMPKGGDLRIGLSLIGVGGDEEPPVANMPPGEWACLTISDTGIGMTEEVRTHLFEPFFTTKTRGEGTGLGLAQVYGIVKQHEGYVGVETAVKRGTTIRVYLPAVETEEADETEGETPSPPRGKGETILLVEDKKGLLAAGREILESLGYRVLTAADGREALEVYRSAEKSCSEQGRGVDLVLTDVVMPEVGGKELIQELRKIDPNVRVLAITGHALTQSVEGLRGAGIPGVVKKPLGVHALAQAVRQALD
jgi:two-component system cell cycle sensor histidine kinase/response regulator CckA